MGFTVTKGSEKGSQKAISIRCLEHPPRRVRPLRRAPYQYRRKLAATTSPQPCDFAATATTGHWVPSSALIMRPEKWDGSQVGFRGSNASGWRLVLLAGAFWAHGASKMAILGASLLPCILQRFRA